MTTGGEVLDDLFGFDDNAPLTEQEKKELLVEEPKAKRPCPKCGKMLTWTADGSRPRAHKCTGISLGNAQPEQPATAPDTQLNMFDPPATPAPEGPPPITVDEVVAKYIAIRELIAEKTKTLEAELAELKDFQKKREAWLLGKLDASGAESMRTPHSAWGLLP